MKVLHYFQFSHKNGYLLPKCTHSLVEKPACKWNSYPLVSILQVGTIYGSMAWQRLDFLERWQSFRWRVELSLLKGYCSLFRSFGDGQWLDRFSSPLWWLYRIGSSALEGFLLWELIPIQNPWLKWTKSHHSPTR